MCLWKPSLKLILGWRTPMSGKRIVLAASRTEWIPIYYFLLGRKLFGHRIKYPLWRLAHLPEPLLRRKLYLRLDRPATRYRVPGNVPAPHVPSAALEQEGLILKEVFE